MFMDESAFELDDLEKDLAEAGLGPNDEAVIKPRGQQQQQQQQHSSTARTVRSAQEAEQPASRSVSLKRALRSEKEPKKRFLNRARESSLYEACCCSVFTCKMSGLGGVLDGMPVQTQDLPVQLQLTAATVAVLGETISRHLTRRHQTGEAAMAARSLMLVMMRLQRPCRPALVRAEPECWHSSGRYRCHMCAMC